MFGTDGTDVVIIGAGVSGLAAARLLGRFGVPCVVLEGGPRIGGRLYTLRRPGWEMPIELGAEFVHGRPAPTLALGGGSIHLVHVPEHHVKGGKAPEPMPNLWQHYAELLAPACEAGELESLGGFVRRSRMSKSDRELVRMMVEGYHAAPLDDVSARSVAADAERSARGFEQYRTSGGYDTVLAELEHGLGQGPCRIQLATRVRRIDWSRGHVHVTALTAAGDRELTARCCIVTTSVGVLRSAAADGGIDIRPRPASLTRALPLLGMGDALRVVLRFERGPWLDMSDEERINFVHSPETPFETFWREVRAGQEQVTAWVGGPKARDLASLDERTLRETAIGSLAAAVGADATPCREALIEAHTHDFIRDSLVRGAYSYVRPGGEQAAQELARPCEDTLFFAGEALDAQYPGTVAGALGSGEHAARQVLAAWAA